MALISTPIIPRDGTLLIEDATGTPIALTVQYEDGDFSIDGFQQSNMAVVSFKDRGVFYAHRKSEEEEVNFTFSAHATDWADATEKTVVDVFNKTGAFSAGVSTLGANADVWAVKLTFTAEQTNYGASADGTIVLSYCVAKVSFAEGLPGKFTIAGRALLTGAAGVART